MAIYAYVGLPGSGKSYGVVANQILPALKAGRIVVTNVPLYEERIRETITSGEIREFPIDQVAQQPELIDDYAPPGCVLIIDELWKLFPAGQKVTHVPQPFKRLLAEHRHMVDEQGRSTQIVLVTQDLAQIGAFARQLVEQTFLHTKLGHLGASGSFRCRIFHGQVTGQNPPRSSEINTTLGRYDERIYRYYKSHTMSKKDGDGANEKAVDSRGIVWKRPIVIAGAIMCVLMLWFGVQKLHALYVKHQPASAASGATGGSQAALVPAKARTIAAVESSTWRVTMLLRSTERQLSYAVLEDERGNTVKLSADRCQEEFGDWVCHYQKGSWRLQSRARPPAEDSRPLFEPLAVGSGS